MNPLWWTTSLLALSVLLAANGPPKVVFLGDSLTEGFGVAQEQAFPQVVAELLKAKGKPIEAINAGISGSTSASAPSRMRWVLKGKPSLVVLALGANDGLRGIPPAVTEQNLAEAIAVARERNVRVLLVGMKAPPNYGADYTHAFEQTFSALAKRFQLPLLPFLLDGVAGRPELNQADGIHPNPAGHRVVAALVAPYVEKLL